MPNLYSLGGKLVSKEEYERVRGINQEVKKKEVKEVKPIQTESVGKTPKPKLKKKGKKNA